MTKTVVTYLTAVSKNKVSDEDLEALLDDNDADSLQEVADDKEDLLHLAVKEQLFAEADEVPLIDVETEVYGETVEDIVENHG